MNKNESLETASKHADTIVKSVRRINNANRGLTKAMLRAKTLLPALLLELARPTLPVIRGVAKVLDGYADLCEGSVNQVNAWVDAIPGMTEAVQKAQDTRGAFSVAEMNSINPLADEEDKPAPDPEKLEELKQAYLGVMKRIFSGRPVHSTDFEAMADLGLQLIQHGMTANQIMALDQQVKAST